MVENRLVSCKVGRYRSGAVKKRLAYVAMCGRCGIEFYLNVYQCKLFIDGDINHFTCGCERVLKI